jgi:hypothetical protein
LSNGFFQNNSESTPRLADWNWRNSVKPRIAINRLLLLHILGSLVFLSASCTHNAPTEKAKRAKAGGGATEPAGEWTKIRTPDDQQVAQLKVEGENTQVEFGSNSLRGEQKESGKRKYQDQSGALISEVKSDADDFKVRTPDGKLLWKVKVNPDKIKISNNEEMTGAFSIESKDTDRAKVYHNEQEIGKVRFNQSRGRVKVENASDAPIYNSNTSRLSAMYGVLLMNDIPEPQRYIIMAELLARGK